MTKPDAAGGAAERIKAIAANMIGVLRHLGLCLVCLPC